MTKGKALIETRSLVGPLGHVRRDATSCEVGLWSASGWTPLAGGETFERALAALRKALGR